MSKPPTSALPENLYHLERIENSLRRVERKEYDEIVSTESFDVFFPEPPNTEAFALPRARTGADLGGDIIALRQVFEERDFIPRVSYFQQLHPQLGGVLSLTGFSCKSRRTVMTLTPNDMTVPFGRNASGYMPLDGNSSVEKAREFIQKLDLACGNVRSEYAQVYATVIIALACAHDNHYIAVLEQEGEIVSGAQLSLTSVDRGVRQLEKVFTVPSRLRQGLALELCQYMLADQCAAGAELFWCVCNNEVEESLCKRIGFRRAGMITDYGLAEVYRMVA